MLNGYFRNKKLVWTEELLHSFEIVKKGGEIVSLHSFRSTTLAGNLVLLGKKKKKATILTANQIPPLSQKTRKLLDSNWYTRK